VKAGVEEARIDGGLGGGVGLNVVPVDGVVVEARKGVASLRRAGTHAGGRRPLLASTFPSMAIVEEIPSVATFLADHAHAGYRRAGRG
jgi:hypothetical protein